MADQEEQTEIARIPDVAEAINLAKVEAFGFWDNDTKVVPEHYIKAFTVNSDASDVALLLGNTYRESGARVDICKMRLIMTHRDFLEFAVDVRKEAAFLTKIYKGNHPGPNPTPEELDKAAKEVDSD